MWEAVTTDNSLSQQTKGLEGISASQWSRTLKMVAEFLIFNGNKKDGGIGGNLTLTSKTSSRKNPILLWVCPVEILIMTGEAAGSAPHTIH